MAGNLMAGKSMAAKKESQQNDEVKDAGKWYLGRTKVLVTNCSQDL